MLKKVWRKHLIHMSGQAHSLGLGIRRPIEYEIARGASIRCRAFSRVRKPTAQSGQNAFRTADANPPRAANLHREAVWLVGIGRDVVLQAARRHAEMRCR